MSSGEADTTSIGIILLAAGRSARLGRPKQSLSYRGTTLLKHSLHAAMASIASQVILVLGANAESIKKEVQEAVADAAASIIINDGWEEGIASSIRCGLTELVQTVPTITGAIIMVCDQPYVSTELLDELNRTQHKTAKQIVACIYEDTLGTPCLFTISMFPELLQLRGDVGAKSLITRHLDQVATISFPEGNMDIDTEAGYKALLTASIPG